MTEIEGPLLTYDQMSDNDLLSCTNSLVTIMFVINHRNKPWGPSCLQLRIFLFAPRPGSFRHVMIGTLQSPVSAVTFGSNLDSCDYCYVLLFVPSHTWIQMFYMSTSNFHPILRSKLISKNNSFWAVFQLIGTSDPWSELPTRVGSFWLLPTGSSRSTKNNSLELPMVCWMFRPCPSEVPSLLR